MDRAPATTLGHEAVATRATFEAHKDETLEYFAPVARTPGFPKALARTLLELRLASAPVERLSSLSRSGPDLAELLNRVELLMGEAGASDRAALFETAIRALGSSTTGWPAMPTLLLDVPFDSEAEARFLWALIQQSPSRSSRFHRATHERSQSFEIAVSMPSSYRILSRTISDISRATCFRPSLRPNAIDRASSCGFRRRGKAASA